MQYAKWMSLPVDFFSRPKISRLLAMRKGADYVWLWLEVVARACQVNRQGSLSDEEGSPMTVKELSLILQEPIGLMDKALKQFEKLDMLMQTETGEFVVTNWELYNASKK